MAETSETTAPIPRDDPPPARTTPERPSRGRAAAAVTCLVLAALLTTPAGIAYWGQRTLNDTERYVATVGPLATSPEMQDVLATKVTNTLQEQVDVEAILTDVFGDVISDRPRLQQLVGPLSAAINGLIERQVREFFASDLFVDIWTRVNTRASQVLQRLLEGQETGAVTLQGDDVVLDVSEVIDQVKARLVDRGLTFVENAPIPQIDRQIVLVEAPRLRQLRTIYAFGNPVAQWALPTVGALYLLALVLARRRPRMTVAVGIAIFVNAVLLGIALSVGRQLFTNGLSGTDFGPASAAFYQTMLTYLDRGQGVLLWFGLTLVVAGWFAGSNRYGTAVRTSLASGLEGVGAVLPAQAQAAGQWVAANVTWLRVVAVVLGFVVLLWGNDITLERWWWSVALVVALLVVLQVLVGAAQRRTPEGAAATPAPA